MLLTHSADQINSFVEVSNKLDSFFFINSDLSLTSNILKGYFTNRFDASGYFTSN